MCIIEKSYSSGSVQLNYSSVSPFNCTFEQSSTLQPCSHVVIALERKNILSSSKANVYFGYLIFYLVYVCPLVREMNKKYGSYGNSKATDYSININYVISVNKLGNEKNWKKMYTKQETGFG